MFIVILSFETVLPPVKNVNAEIPIAAMAKSNEKIKNFLKNVGCVMSFGNGVIRKIFMKTR